MDLIDIFLIVVGVTNIFLGFITYFNKIKRTRIDIVFSLLAFNVAFWSLAMAFYRYTDSGVGLDVSLKILYLVPIFIPVFFLEFSCIFSQNSCVVFKNTLFKNIFLIWSFVLTGLVIFTKEIIDSVSIPDVGEKIINFGPIYSIYVAHFFLFFGLSFFILLRMYLRSSDIVLKSQIKYLFAGTFVSSLLGMLTNLILPWFGFFALNWLGNILTIFFVGFILYAILNHHLFNVKIIATEIFIIFILIVLFIDVFFVKDVIELVIKSLVLMSTAFLGFLLIKGVYKEVESRERIEKLANDLEQANIKLLELDKLKSEFLSLATHQIRGPIAVIKGYTSMINEGSFGKVSKKVSEAVDRVFQSGNNLGIIVDDFLNISRIEQGRMKYDFIEVNISELLRKTVEELRLVATKKGLSINSSINGPDCYVTADIGKIRQVIYNLIDNSIKYTLEGSIDVSLKINGNNTLSIIISDMGVGISKDVLPKLFEKFSRASDAYKTNVSGTGLGLYVAKKMIDAHNGKIWAESEGEGKGSKFFIELNLIKK